MRYFRKDRPDELLFCCPDDSRVIYTHGVTEGDRLICCMRSESEAKRIAAGMRIHTEQIIRDMKTALDADWITRKYEKKGKVDYQEEYGSAGALFDAIKRQERKARAIGVVELIRQ